MLVVDYADVDGNDPPDFAAAYASGARVAIIRRSVCFRSHGQFILRSDTCYARDAQRAREVGLVVGSYLFPSWDLGAPSPQAQVRFFASCDGSIVRGVDLPPAFDLEFPGNGIADTGRTQVECLTITAQFIDALHATYGCSPIVYTSHVQVHDDNGLGLPEHGEWPVLGACPLWVKVPYRLKANEAVDQVAPVDPKVPAPWHGAWWLRQSQGDAVGFPGFSHTVDVGDFHLASEATLGDSRVSWIQRRVGADSDGVWGHGTTAAVRARQTEAGLVPDGVIGPKTFSVLAWK